MNLTAYLASMDVEADYPAYVQLMQGDSTPSAKPAEPYSLEQELADSDPNSIIQSAESVGTLSNLNWINLYYLSIEHYTKPEHKRKGAVLFLLEVEDGEPVEQWIPKYLMHSLDTETLTVQVQRLWAKANIHSSIIL